MFPAKTMMRILDQERPDVVITTTMNRFEAAALYAAGKLGIATVKVEDLIGRIYKTFPDKIQVDTEEEKKEEPKEEIKPVKKENRKVHKKKDSLDDISVDDMGLGNIVNKIAEEELKNKEEKPEETSSVEEVETDDNSEVSVDTNTRRCTRD